MNKAMEQGRLPSPLACLQAENNQFKQLLQAYRQQIATLQEELATQTRLKLHWLTRANQLRKERDAARQVGSAA